MYYWFESALFVLLLFSIRFAGYARIVLAIIAFWFMSTNYVIAGWCYIISALLDAVDGHAARAFNQSESTINNTNHNHLYNPQHIIHSSYHFGCCLLYVNYRRRSSRQMVSIESSIYVQPVHTLLYIPMYCTYIPVKTNVFNTCVFWAYFDHWVTCPQLISFVTITHCIRMCVVYHSYSSPIRIYNL